ncbi:MAG: hypothetical protein QG657_5821 [Acidobacteriota bacterium]|nr:hypothetical protein [Acidobacteriota bacterium]
MKKRFNITGVCFPEEHYMVDVSNKINDIFAMVEQGDYFVINRPRQYGKTTTLYMLNRLLKTSDDYFPIQTTFEGIGKEGFDNAAVFIDAFLLLLKEEFSSSGADKLVKFIDSEPLPDRIDKLGLWIGKLVKETGKKIVLMIDEVDKSSNNQLFLDFLGMLRKKYLKRREPGQYTFHSVILAGVHDVKSLKIKIRKDTEAKFNSPWNIAVDFKVDLSFSVKEIESMLEVYSTEQQVTLDIPYFARQLFYLTSGYPFLVSQLCKIIHEELLPAKKNRNEWQPEDVEKAVQISLNTDNTNSESLIQNLENNPDLYELVFDIIMNGAEFSFNTSNPIILFGKIYGVLKDEMGKVKIHNRLYEQRVYNYMASKLETASKAKFNHFTARYLDETGGLDIKKVFLKFQDFMKEHYSQKDREFLERNGRLLFLAFIRPILNGRGFDFKEVQVSEENRLDIVVTFNNKKHIIELKIWRGESYHRDGIRQLCGYLDIHNESMGYLLIYDLRKESGLIGKNQLIEMEGKTILAAWV